MLRLEQTLASRRVMSKMQMVLISEILRYQLMGPFLESTAIKCVNQQ